MRFVLYAVLVMSAGAVSGAPRDAVFPSIDGGMIALADFAGQPILVVNTASQCGFTPQYDGLQALHDRYSAQGLLVLTVPSDDFNQELGSTEEIKEFCEINFNLTVPMTDVMPILGEDAHPFYQDVKSLTGFEPRWNFNKVLIDGEGNVVETWGASERPDRGAIPDAIEALLK
ncbi:MAG: glutathione peroxidase [Sulfitobacter sp.]